MHNNNTRRADTHQGGKAESDAGTYIIARDVCCVKCGKPVVSEGRFCPYCGRKDPLVPPTQSPRVRGNGEGSVWRDKRTGKWTAQVTIGWYGGKRKFRTKTGLKTKKEALEYLPKLREGIPDKRDLRVCAIWNAMHSAWLDGISPGKANHYRTAYQRMERLHNADITRLITQDWQDVIDALPGKYDPKKEAKVVVSKLYQYAIAQGWCTVNMADYIKLPKQTSTNKDSFTPEELHALKVSWDRGYKWSGYVLLMCYTGMRPGELKSIKLADVHPDELYMIGGIKTEAGRNRTIGFPAWLKPVVEWAVGQATGDKLLAIGEERFYTEYYAALDDAGIVRTDDRPMTPHCCRHTFVTMANDTGLNLAHVQTMAGHSDPSITARYNHTHKAELVAEWQKLLEP